MATKEKINPIDIIDQMEAGAKQSVPNKKLQSYRNAATSLKRFKNKHYVIRAIGKEYFIFRLM